MALAGRVVHQQSQPLTELMGPVLEAQVLLIIQKVAVALVFLDKVQ